MSGSKVIDFAIYCKTRDQKECQALLALLTDLELRHSGAAVVIIQQVKQKLSDDVKKDSAEQVGETILMQWEHQINKAVLREKAKKLGDMFVKTSDILRKLRKQIMAMSQLMATQGSQADMRLETIVNDFSGRTQTEFAQIVEQHIRCVKAIIFTFDDLLSVNTEKYLTWFEVDSKRSWLEQYSNKHYKQWHERIQRLMSSVLMSLKN